MRAVPGPSPRQRPLVSPPAMVSVCLEARAQVRPVCVNAPVALGPCLWPQHARAHTHTHIHTHMLGWAQAHDQECSRCGGEPPQRVRAPRLTPPAAPSRAYLAWPATTRPARARPSHPLMRQRPPTDGPCLRTDQFVSTEGRELQSKPIMRIPLRSGHAD